MKSMVNQWLINDFYMLQTSHLQEYPIDKKGASCRKLFTGVLFMVYVALCLFLVIFVIGGPELGAFFLLI